jgi:D-alanine-D-alanine ligase-like ATP-grasp enzyme
MFMEKMGYPVIRGQAFFSKKWCQAIGSERGIDQAYGYALKLGFPVIIKPNSGSQGAGVVKVYNKTEFFRAMKKLFYADKVVIVQELVHGRDYRLVVVDDKLISAYERIPLNIVGDGRSSITHLLEMKQKKFQELGRDTSIDFLDDRMRSKLKRQNLSFDSVIPLNKKVFLLDNANLSTGGDAVDVTAEVHPFFRETAVRLASDMGLRLCGIDLMIERDITEKNAYKVIEINAAPGLDHYVKTGSEQKELVDRMYLEILKAI